MNVGLSAHDATPEYVAMFYDTFLVGNRGFFAIKAASGKPIPVKAKHLTPVLLAHFLGTLAPAANVTAWIGGRPAYPINGHLRVGAYAIGKSNRTKWLCLDLDGGGSGHKYPLKDPKAVAIKIYRRAESLGLKPYLESSGSATGFHIWICFCSPIPAAIARELGFFLCPDDALLESGELACARKGRGLEVFAKQDEVRDGGLGNLVWLPYWFGAAPGGNLFYRPNGDVLELFFPRRFDTVSEDDVLRVIPKSGATLNAENFVSRSIANQKAEVGEKKRLPISKFQRVLDHCPALRQLAVRATVEVFGHEEGLALVWIALQFDGGREWIRQNMKGWDQSRSDARELDQSERQGYSSLSCASMQDRGLCTFRHPEACLRRKLRNGVAVDPNPIRFAYGAENQGEKLNSIIKEIRAYRGKNE